MKILKKKTAPRYVRKEGITSYLLASPRTCDAKHLTTTLVEIKPGGHQRIHTHLPEQVYFILEGSGLMVVATKRKVLNPGIGFSSVQKLLAGCRTTAMSPWDTSALPRLPLIGSNWRSGGDSVANRARRSSRI